MSKEESENQKFLFSINKTIEELLSSIENNIPVAQFRLDQFIDAFDKGFPWDTKPEDRGRAEAITWALMDGPLVLYALNMNSSAIIELHSIIERFVLRETIKHLVVPSKRSPTFRILERRALPDLALILCDLGILDKKDVKFAKELNKLRNGLAHKNPKIISNMVYSGKKISVLDIDSVMTRVDCIPLIIRSIHLLVKMSKIENSNEE